MNNHPTTSPPEVSIETKELRGVNLKNLLAVVSATIVICTTVLTTKASIEQQINQMELKKEGDDKYNDLRIRTLEMKMDAIQLQMKDLNDRFENLKPNK